MKYIALAIGLFALVAGAELLWPVSQPVWASARDTDLLWRSASGPNGERSPASLPLYQAVFAHDREKVASLLDKGVSANSLLAKGRWSPLMVAIAFNDRETVDLLVKRGADLNYVSDDFYATPLAVALSYGRFYTIEHPDFSMLHYLLDSGADVNVEFENREDIAIFAATLGQMNIVNELLARGYRRDLPGLLITLKIIHVDDRTQPKKDKAIATVMKTLAEPEYRTEIPNLLSQLRLIIGNEQEKPWIEDSPHKDPERDREVIALEGYLK